MVFEAIAELIAERNDCDPSTITPDMKFSDLGIDSLDTVEMLMNLEDKIGQEIERNGLPCSAVELVSSKTTIKLEAHSFSLSDKLSSIIFYSPTVIDGVEVPADADVWQLALAPKQ